MRLKTLLSSAAVMTVLIGTAGFAHDARAQKGVVLSPQTGWAVTNVQDDGSGGGAYCAMARRFRDNMILTVARNTDQESSFALDFPQGNFDTRQSAAIVLDPGAGEQRTYEIRPVSKRAFVIRLGHDEAFFAALAKTGILRAEIGTETYNFSLPDIDSGQTQLEQCLNGPAPATSAAADQTPSPSSLANTEQYRKDMADLQQKIDALHEQNSRLAEVLDQQRAAPAVPVPAVQPVPDNSEELRALSQKISLLESENSSLKNQLDAVQQSSSTADSSKTILQSEIDRLRAENAALNTQLASAQTSSATQGDMERRVQSLQEENTRLNALLKSTNDSFSKLVDESKRMQDEMQARAGTPDEMAALNTKVASLESENRRLTQDLAAARSSNDVRNSVQARSLEDANRLLQAQIDATNDKDNQLAALSEQLKLAEAENGYLKEQIGTIGKTQQETIAKQTATFEAETARLQQELAAKTADQQSLLSLQNDLQNLKLEKEQLAGENIRLKSEAQTASAKMSDEARQKIATLESENAALKAEASNSLTSSIAAKNELVTLQAKVTQLESERQNLTQALASAQGDMESKVNGEIAFLRNENDRIKLALEQEQAKAAALQPLQGQYETLRAENEKLKADVLTASATSDTASMQMKAALDENARLKTEMAALQAQSSETSSLIAKVQTLETDNKRLNDALTAASSSDVAAQSEAVAKLTAENTRLQQELAAKTSSVPAEVQVALDGLQKTNGELTTRLETMNGELETLKNENASLKTTQTASLSESELQQQVENLKLENSILREKAAKDVAANETSGADEQIAALQKEISELRAENAAISGDLRNAQQALKDAPKEEAKIAKAEEPAPAPVAKEETKSEPVAAAPAPERAPESEPVKMAETAPAPEAPVEEVKQEAQPQAPVSAPVRSPSKRAYAAPQDAQNEAQALEAEMAGELQELREAKAARTKAAEPMPEEAVAEEGPVVETVAAEPLPVPEGGQQDETIQIKKGPEQAAAQPPEESDEAPAVETASTADSGPIGKLLAQAHIPLKQPIATAPGSAGKGSVLYHWNSGGMMGMAEQQPLKNEQAFDTLAEQYLERAQKDCAGDFAVMLDRTEDVGATRIDSYEAACVGKQVSSGATLIFYSQEGTFTAMAHKAKADNMEETMEARDRLMEVIGGSAG